MLDVTFYTYCYLSAISITGLILFLWWGIKNRWHHVSPAYIYVMALFFSVIVEHGTHVAGRIVSFHDPQQLYDWLVGWWWPARLIPLVIALSFIVGHILWRAFGPEKED